MSGFVERLSLELQGGPSWAPWAGLVAFAILVLLAARATAGAAPGRRGVLLALRIAGAAAVILLALQPALRRESVAVSTAPVAVIVDASGSMSVRESRDGGAGETRMKGVASWLRARSAEIDELETAASVQWYAASDGRLRPVTRAEAESGDIPARGDTDLAETLRALQERHPSRERPAVLLLSDGADNGALGRAVAQGADLAGVVPPGGPIVAVAPAAGRLADRSIEVVARDPVGFLRTDVTIRVRVRSRGLGAEEVPVTLSQSGRVVQVRAVKVGGESGEEAEATLTLKATQVGESLFAVSVPLAAGEAILDNNEQAFSVRIVRDRIRVLQLVGRPSWDGRFLRELLKRDPAIDLISFFILRTQWDETMASTDELSLIPFPIRELFDEKLGSFDLVIFQNFGFGAHGIEPYLDVLASHVRDDGAGMLVIGGDLGLGRDWAGEDVGSVMPVDTSAARWRAGKAAVRLTDVGARHPVLRMAGEGREPRAIVEGLLPVTGVHEGLRPKPGAQVLLEAGPDRRPLLVAGESGAGRVLVMATDGSWRWSLPMAERPGGTRTYEALWQASLRWLIRDERSNLVLLEADRRALAPGESAEVRAWVRGETYEPRRDEPVTFVVTDASGRVVSESQARTGEDGVARLALEPAQAGPLAITASTARGGAGPLYLEAVDRSREMADVAARPEVLEALARHSGGEMLALEGGRGRIGLTAQREERVESVTLEPLWRTWWAWALVAGLLCVEWWLRRRWGLA